MLKPYENRHEYTVEGEEFQRGFENLLLWLTLKAETDNTVYIDTEDEDIRAIASCYYTSLPNTRSGLNKKLFEWKLDGMHPVAAYIFNRCELEECISEDEIRELRRQFEEEKEYDENLYEDKEEFYEDYALSYVEFLLNAENKGIDQCVKDYLKDAINFYKKDFDERYYELLEEEKEEEHYDDKEYIYDELEEDW